MSAESLSVELIKENLWSGAYEIKFTGHNQIDGPERSADRDIEFLLNRIIYLRVKHSETEEALAHEKERGDALMEFVEHERNCIRTFQEAGRPTPDGGYETMFKGVWYQSKPVNKEPECNCGLEEAIRAYEETKPVYVHNKFTTPKEDDDIEDIYGFEDEFLRRTSHETSA